MEDVPTCWCGNTTLKPFSPDYLWCAACGTLVAARMPSPEALHVTDDNQDFYGRSYFEQYQADLGLPTISERARLDLPERCVYWLRALLRYKLPPGRTLEVGSSHGGFVALARWAGFDAEGLELSPWVIEFARKAFGVPVLRGPVEECGLPPQSLDAVIMMDVLEHIGNPAETIRHCAGLLKSDGVFLIQTPCYPDGKSYAELSSGKDVFTRMLLPEQHLFLFSRRSVGKLLQEAGLRHMRFEQALFPYDMFLAASPGPLATYSEEDAEGRLDNSPSGRLVRALLGSDKRLTEMVKRYQQADADRNDRLKLLEENGRRLAELDKQAAELNRQVIELNAACRAFHSERAALLEMTEARKAQLAEIETLSNALMAQSDALRRQSEKLESHRDAHLAELEKSRDAFSAECEALRRQSEKLESRRDAHLAELEKSRDAFSAECEALRRQIETAEIQHRFELAGLQDSRDTLDAQCEALRRQIENLEARCEALRDTEDRLNKLLAQSKAEEGALQAVIQAQNARVATLEQYNATLLSERDDLRKQLELSLSSCNSLQAEFETLARQYREEKCSVAEQIAQRAQARLQSMEAEVEEHRQRLSSSDSALRDALARCAGLEAQLTRSSADLAERQRAFEEQARSLAELNSAKQTLEGKVARLEHLLDRLRHSYIFRGMRSVKLWGWLEYFAPPQAPAAGKGQLKHIAVDLTPVLPGGENGGAKLVALEILDQMGELLPNCRFTLLTSERNHDELCRLNSGKIQCHCVSSERRGETVKKVSDALGRRLLHAVRAVLRRGIEAAPRRFGPGLAGTLGADLLFCPFTEPSFAVPGVPTVSVVHDLQYAYYPQFFSPEEIQERDRTFRNACRRATRIITVSEYVRGTVLEKSDLPAERVTAIYNTLRGRVQEPSETVLKSVHQRYGLQPDEFLLYPANFWPHKNHDMLLTAFGIYCSRQRDSRLKLVLTGAPGERQDRLRAACVQMGLSHRVVFPGYIPDEELAALLRSCFALIFPSLYEGFGIPVLEAMSCGKPVACSNVTSLPELGGDAVLLFDPRKPEEIAGAITKIAADPEYANSLASKGRRRAEQLGGPREMAAAYLRVFREAVGSPAAYSNALYGIYSDGWCSKRSIVTHAAGPEGRKLALELETPDWIPADAVSLTVLTGDSSGPSVQRLRRGENRRIEVPLPAASGYFELHCEPTFRPVDCGTGSDTRALGLKIHTSQITLPDGTVERLTWEQNGV